MVKSSNTKKIPKTDAFVIIMVSGVTVITHNLALAVISGVIVWHLDSHGNPLSIFTEFRN